MPYAVVLYLDAQASHPIRQAIQELALKDVAPYMEAHSVQPHVTLAIYDNLDCQLCERKIARAARIMRGLTLNFAYLGVFHSESVVVYLGATPTQELLAIQKRVHGILNSIASNPWDLYLPGKWIPHCSLAIELSPRKLQKAMQVCMEIALPLTISIVSLGIMQFEPLQPIYTYAIHGYKIIKE